MKKHVRTSENDLIAYAEGLDYSANGKEMTAKHVAAHDRIVRACNAHDDLVAALEGLCIYFADYADEYENNTGEKFEPTETAKAALAKAKGE